MATTTTHPTFAANSSRPPFQAQTAAAPSQNVAPNRMNPVPQQADMRPDDRTRAGDLNVPNASPPRAPAAPTGPVPWKEQVIAYAKKTRGKVLRKPTLTEHGDQILAGEASAWEPTRKP